MTEINNTPLPPSNIPGEQEEVPKKKKGTLIVIIVVLIVIAVAAVVGGATYFLQKKSFEKEKNKAVQDAKKELQDQIEALQNQINQIKKEVPEITETPDIDETLENTKILFENALNQKDYTTLKGLLTDPVNYILEATECCGQITPDEAISHLEGYLASMQQPPTQFNFSEEQQVVKQFRVNLADYFAKYTAIGIGDNGTVFAFHINEQNKIDEIFIAVSHTLFDLE